MSLISAGQGLGVLPVIRAAAAVGVREVLAESVIRVERQPGGHSPGESDLERIVVALADIAEDIRNAGILRKRPQHLADRAPEIRERQGHARYDGLSRGDIRRRRLRRQQAAEREVPRVHLIRPDPAPAAVLVFAVVAGVSDCQGHAVGQSSLH